jgi:hypothetical protein
VLYKLLYTALVASTRTQIYLTAEQRRRIDQIAKADGVSMADVVRRAVDKYLADAVPNPRPSLEETFGVLPDLTVPSRDEWDRG